jgi:hypothetical protein
MNQTMLRMKIKTDGIQYWMHEDDLFGDPIGMQELPQLMQRLNLLQSRIVSCQRHDLECRPEVPETLTQDRRERYECCQP